MKAYHWVIASLMWTAVLCGVPAVAAEKEPPAAKHVREAQAFMEKAAAGLAALEILVGKEDASADIIMESAAMVKDLKKARRAVEWAALDADAGVKSDMEKFVEASGKIKEALSAASQKTTAKARASLSKAAKEADKTRSAGALCLENIASGKNAGEDPFADTQIPTPANVENLTREAAQSGRY